MSKFTYFLQKFNDFSLKIDENSINSNDFLLIRKLQCNVINSHNDNSISYQEYKILYPLCILILDKSREILRNEGILH